MKPVALQGKRYVSLKLAERMAQALVGDRPGAGSAVASLSHRELEVLELISNGLGSRQIAEQLHVSIKTIQSHREHLKAKLGLTRAKELVSYAYSRFRAEPTPPRLSQ